MRKILAVATVALAISLGTAEPGDAASVTLKLNVITITGAIDSRTPQEFTTAAKRIRDWGLVILDSEGGDVVSALTIGRLIRARNFETDVTNNALCASACIFILAAGVDRSAYGRIGIHRPHYDDTYFAGLGPADP